MSREWPRDARSSRLLSLSAASPRLVRSAFSRQSVALSIVAIEVAAGWAVVLAQAAAPALAGVAATTAAALAAAATTPVGTPRID